MHPSPAPTDASLQTRDSLLNRLKESHDQAGWQEFFERYWRLIYGFARKAGMGDADAQDIVQEVMLSVVKSVGNYRKQQGGSFKGWLLSIVRRRMADHWRAKLPQQQLTESLPDNISALASDDAALDQIWQEEWESRLFETASQLVQQRVGARNYLIFDMLVRQETPLKDVCRSLGVGAPQAYLAKHRVARMMKQEVAKLREGRE